MTPTSPSAPRAPQGDPVRLARQVASALEPTESLRAIADLRKSLDALEILRVDAALQAGCSWRVIAEALGISRQAAHRKHAARAAAAAAPSPGAQPSSVAGNRLVIVGPARVAVVLARQEAAIVQSRRVGTDHLLSGLLREREGAAAAVLTGLGATLEKVRHCSQVSAEHERGDPETEDLTPPSWATPTRLPFSRRGHQALEQSLREAVRLGDDRLDVEHLLLALLRDPTSRAVGCLEHLKITPAMVEQELLSLRLRRSPAERPPLDTT